MRPWRLKSGLGAVQDQFPRISCCVAMRAVSARPICEPFTFAFALIRADPIDFRANQSERECEGEAVMSKPWRVNNGRFATHDSRTLLMHSPLALLAGLHFVRHSVARSPALRKAGLRERDF